MRFLLTSLIIFTAFIAHAQYWIGPKAGMQRTDFIYHDKEYKKDSFDVPATYGFHAGAVLIYQATDRYSVRGELLWERLTKVVKDREGAEIPVYSKSNYNYLSVPFSLRMNFGHEPVHFYVGGGPKLSFLLGGTGILKLQELEESKAGAFKDYRIVFNDRRSNGDTKLAISEANRVQYALTASAGCFMDLVTGARLSVDIMYSFGHSNVGFNDNPDFNQFAEYSENFRYRQNILSVSFGYFLEYDAQLQRKGQSTNRLTRDSRKKHKKK